MSTLTEHLKHAATRFRREAETTAAAVLFLRLLQVALEFVCSLVLVRIFSASAYGSYAFSIAAVGLLAIPASLGFDRLLIRETAVLVARRQWALLRGLLRRTSQMVLPLSLLLAAAGFAFVRLNASTHVDDGTRAALEFAMLLLPVLAIARVRLAALQGLGFVILGLAPEMILQPVALLMFAVLAHAASILMLDGKLIVGLHIVAVTAANAAGLMILRRRLPTEVRSTTPQYQTRTWLVASVPFAWMLGMNLVLITVDTLMVGIYDSATAAGVYRVASQMAMLTALPLTAVSVSLAPNIATLYAQGNFDGLQVKTTRAARVILASSAIAFTGLLLLGPHALGLFGPEFGAGYTPLVILSAGYLANAAMGPTGYLLIMTKYQTAAALGFTAAALLNVAANALLVPIFGLNGAAVATAGSIIFLSFTFAFLVRRNLGICSTSMTGGSSQAPGT